MRYISQTILMTLLLTTMVLLLTSLVSRQADAAWYEAKGQAVIVDGDKETAKRAATQEALKQAMLFAGASVHSVHRLTNGLLENEEMTIRSTGEVESLELIDEIYSGNIVTVSVRADIFPKAKVCKAQDDEKHFSTTHFLVRNRQQLTEGNMSDFDEAFTQRLAHTMQNTTENLRITHVVPHTARFPSQFTAENVRSLSAQSNTQFVIIGVIDDLSIETEKASLFIPWRSDSRRRAFSMTVRVYDGINGGLLFTNTYNTAADWTFDRFESVDEFSSQFWRSRYGNALQASIEEAVQDIKEATACQPITGRVIHVAGDNISVSLGRDNGIEDNDELFLYQAKEVIDNRGRKYLQYSIYPGTFTVRSAYGNSSTLVSKQAGIVANVQENDFVVKK